ncbi:MAG: LamG protein, partial [uncultured bacterium]
DATNQVACKNDFDCPTYGKCSDTAQNINVCANASTTPCSLATVATDCPSVSISDSCNVPSSTHSYYCSLTPTISCVYSTDCPVVGQVPASTCNPTTKKCANFPTQGCFYDGDCGWINPDNECTLKIDSFNVCANSPSVKCTNADNCPKISGSDTCIAKGITTKACSNNPNQPCSADTDCFMTRVCAVQKDKLRRDFLRLSDIRTIEQALEIASSSNGNKYPDLKSGSYLTGQTVSTWSSWTTLSSAVGVLLPVDPVNKLGVAGTCAVSTTVFCTTDANCEAPVTSSSQKCLIHDPATGWSTADRRFSFACAPNSLAYRYIATSSANYKVRFSMEDIGLQLEPQNVQDIFSFFIDDLAHFNAQDYLSNTTNNTGICNQDQEISTVSQGVCGDGQINLNLGEECDPEGKVEYIISDCVGATSSMPLRGKVCGDDCRWGAPIQLSTCGQKFGKCGNGLIELSETCDDGSQNGKYNHCNQTCDGFAALCGDGQVTTTFEYCDTASLYENNDNFNKFYVNTAANNSSGWCVGGINDNNGCVDDASCNIYQQDYLSGSKLSQSSHGKCITLDISKNRYSLSKQKACSFDCQKVGSYCGDGHVDVTYGEECDGNGQGDGSGEINCTINKQPATRRCSAKCRWENDSAVFYYNFNDAILQPSGYLGSHDETYIYNFAGTSSYPGLGSSLNKYQAHCGNLSSISCPYDDPNGAIGRAMGFDGISKYFKIDQNSSLNLNELTISAWIKVNSTTSDGWHTILAKQNGLSATVNERDYNFYIFVTSSKVTNLYFASQQATNVRILGDGWALDPSNTSSIFVNEDGWNFVAVTVDANRKGKFYNYDADKQAMVQLGNTFSNGNPALRADRNYPLTIGAADFYFNGSIDELQLYGRALSLDEIQDLHKHTNNFCQLKTITPSTPTEEVVCGNDKIDSGEDCDNGAQNGTVCTATYGKGCWYCTYKTCKRINVSPLGYCGDGFVNGPEACDVDGAGTIYSSVTTTGSYSNGLGTASVTTTHGYQVASCSQEYNTKLNLSSLGYFNAVPKSLSNLSKKVGIKTCSADCKTLNYKTCVECGLSSSGIKVGGGLINVLDPSSPNPLIVEGVSTDLPYGHQGTLGLGYFTKNEITFTNANNIAYKYFNKTDGTDGGNEYSFNPIPYSIANNSVVAAINPDPICSDPTQNRNYYLQFNADGALAHRVYYPVSPDKPADQYNLLLSPVIQNNNNAASRPRDIRIVVSWENRAGTPVVGQNTFAAGFLGPSGLIKTYEGADLTNSIGFNDYSNSSTPFYLTVSSSPFGNIWYHNLGGVKNLYEEAFTINTENLAASSYAFYVRSATSTTMINYNNIAHLKVDVYMPEEQSSGGNADIYRHFSQPVKTYYLDNNTYYADANSTNAKFWHVFNILSTGSSDTATLSTAIEDNPRYYNRTVTNLNMTYTSEPNTKYP